MKPPMIELQAVSKVYGKDQAAMRAMKGVNLRVEGGEFIAIMGSSGSGKSTCMNILGCLDTPTSGHYELAGQDVTQLGDDTLAYIRNKEIGFVFQTFNLLPRATAFENVELPLIYGGVDGNQRRELTWNSLEIVGLADRASHRPNELSGGQRQRVAIARALVNEPEIIIADEPTAHLDGELSAELLNILRELNEGGVTMVVATHDPRVMAHPAIHRRVAMMDGRIVGGGAP